MQTGTPTDNDRAALEILAAYQPPALETVACETVTGWASEYDRREQGGRPRYVRLSIDDRRDGGREVADVRAWVQLTQWGSIQAAAVAMLEGRAFLKERPDGSGGEVQHGPALEAAGILKDGRIDVERVTRLTRDGIDRIRVDAEGWALVPMHEAMFPRARDPRATGWRALAEITSHTFYQNGASWVNHYAHLRGAYGDALDITDRAREVVEAEIMAVVREHAPEVLEERTPAAVVEIHAGRVASSMAHNARHALHGGHYAVWRALPSEVTRGKGSPDGSVELPTDAEMRRRAVALMLDDAETLATVLEVLDVDTLADAYDAKIAGQR